MANNKKRPGVPLFRCLNHPCRNKIWSNQDIVCTRQVCQQYAKELPVDTYNKYLYMYKHAMQDLQHSIDIASKQQKEAYHKFRTDHHNLAVEFRKERRIN